MVKQNELLAPTPEQPQAVADAPKRQDIGRLLERHAESIKKALPKQISAERFSRIVLTALRTNKALLECNSISLLAGIIRSAQLGLSIDNGLGEAYLIPFKGQVQFIPGYRGLMKLARQGGVHFDVPRDVHEGDHFEYSFGMNETLCHRPIAAIRTEKTMTHVYVKATTPDGVVRFDVMTKAEVDAVRERSKSKSNGPWVTDYLAMAKKTVIRRISKYLPCSEELHQAVADDEAAERGEQVSFRELDLIEPEDDTAEVTA